MKKFPTAREFARETGMSETFIRRLIAQGRCPGLYSGNRFLINAAALTEALEKQSRKCLEG